MFKFAILATAITIAAPAVAQDQSVAAGRTPMAGTPEATVDQTSPVQSTPATDPAQAEPSPATPASAAAAQPATGSQVAQVVNTEFPSYDKDSNGALNETEFGGWMVALKTASDPTTKAESAATKSWVAGAFAQADKDKSKSVSKDELTGFLSQGQS